jgi:hypothetical protein
MITIKSNYNFFKQIADKHKLIHSFGYGEIEDIEPFIGTNKLYPMMWVNLISTSVTDSLINREYNIIIGDLELNGRENYIDITNQTEQIALDILNTIYQNGQNTYDVYGIPTLMPFQEDFSETLAGTTLNFTIQSDNNFKLTGNCDAPFDSPIVYDPNDGTDKSKPVL